MDSARTIKTPKSRENEFKSRSMSPKKSVSPDKRHSAVSSAKSSYPKSAKSAKSSLSGKSKSPKRKSTGRNDFYSASFNEPLKSTPELEDLSFQGLTLLGSKLFTKITLRKLILSGNNLRSLPSTISDLINLEHLDLSRNPLKVKDVDDPNCLPYEMRLLKNLKYFSISECNLRFIPTSLWLCSSLEILDLSRNKLGLLVPDIGNLQNLKYLYLSQTHITTLPNEIAFCGELVEIIMMANQIESLPETLKECKKLQYLRMSFRTFSTLLDTYMENLISKGQIRSEHLPVVLFELEMLAEMDLKHTKINNLPENNLTNLQNLYLDYNFFDNFTENVFKQSINTLRCLTITHNLLKDIPSEINTLVNLEILDLSFNFIVGLSTELKTLKLKELYLQNNKLSSLNSSLASLKALIKLNLEKNELKSICESVFELDTLEYLNISYNKIECLSPSICKLKALKQAHSYDKIDKIGLWMLGNPLVVPPKEIWQTQNILKLFNYMGSYNQRNLNHVFYSKIIFLGKSGIKKSIMINTFFNNRKEPAENKDNRTHVARRFYIRTRNKVEWFILDVGGEDIYSTLHSIFISSIDFDNEPTFFALVYNHDEYTTNEHENHIGKWIQSILIHTHVPQSVKIIIKLIGICQNHPNSMDAMKLNQVFETSQKTIDNYYEILSKEIGESSEDPSSKNFATNLQKKRVQLDPEIQLIESTFKKESIEKVMSSLEKITISLNKTAPLEFYYEVKDYLTKLRTNRINLSDLIENIKANKKLKSVSDVFSLINYAKSIGMLFWWKQNKDLKDVIFFRFKHMLNCLKTYVSHDIIKNLDTNNRVAFKNIGVYLDDFDFNKSFKMCQKYGSFENRMIKGLNFERNHETFEKAQESIGMLRDLFLIYESETDFIDEKCPFYQIIIPSMCLESFEDELKFLNESSPESRSFWSNWADDIYTDNYEKYFLKLDYLRSLREYLKHQNAMTKKKINWNSKGENYNVYQSEPVIPEFIENNLEEDLTLINLNQIFIDSSSFINLAEKIDVHNIKSSQLKQSIESLDLNFSYKHAFECCSPFKLHKNIFSVLSALIQNISFERFDWSNVIIGRNVDDSCFKIEQIYLDDNKDNIASKLRIELKTNDVERLNKLKEQMLTITDNLFNFFPGFYFFYKVLP